MADCFGICTEYGALRHVIMGRGEGYHRDPARVEIVNVTQADTARSTGHPGEAQLVGEFAAFRTAMEQAGVTVSVPGLAPDSVQDQTCPRDIGFVIGDTFVAAGMRVASRVEEIEGIRHILGDMDGPRLHLPDGVCLEGGDVLVDGPHVFVGYGQRSDAEGAAFLQAHFSDRFTVVPLPTRALDEGEDILHLDCAFQPLGLGHALIYPDGLATLPDAVRAYDWIEVTRQEATALATNVISVAPDHVIARTAPDCARVNAALRAAGYKVTEVAFDAVPGTGGSFRCATLPLSRAAA